MAFAEGLNNSILFPALLKYFEDKRAAEERMNRFNQFNQGTTETVYKPQGETTYGQPEGIGVRYPTTLPTVQPVRQGVPLDSPQFLNAAMQFLGGGGSQPDLNSLIQLRTMGLPQYTTTEGAQGQLLEQEKNRLTGQTKGVRQLTPPVITPRDSNPMSHLLRTENVKEGVRNKVKNTYGYIDPITNKEMVTKVDYEDFSPPNSPSLMPESIMNNMLRQFNADPNVRKQQQILDFSSSMKEMLDTKNPVADNAIPTFMARASGEVGNLSEADKAPFGGSLSLAQRITRTTERLAKGTLDDTDRQFVRQLAETFERSANKNTDAIARKRAKQFSQANKGKFSEEDAYNILNPFGLEQNARKTGVPTDEEIDKMTPQQLQEYLNRK